MKPVFKVIYIFVFDEKARTTYWRIGLTAGFYNRSGRIECE